MTGGTHVVFGTGPAGRAVGTALVDQGARVRMINRSGTPVLQGVETIGGDGTDPVFARDVAIDADTVYFCLNAPHYHRWAEEFPPLQRSVLGAATAANATLVVLENLYMYGPNPGPLRETTPVNPTSPLGSSVPAEDQHTGCRLEAARANARRCGRTGLKSPVSARAPAVSD